ncbi:MAG: NAD(+)--rifampin ADP-ribosyltransferase [Flavobacteriales bacterium]|nr:NAD(+)--rifampin ADP-ribosyltransferase [Flavobacteriales bacterium]
MKIATRPKRVSTQTLEKTSTRKYIFLAATLDPAIWAGLAVGEGRERIYLVEPTEQLKMTPDLTARNSRKLTMSYRSKEPFRVVGEITIWQGHPPEQVKAMKDGLAALKQQGSIH